MFDLSNSLTREKFSSQVRELAGKGVSYLDAIMHLQSKYEIHEKEISRLLDSEVKDTLEAEAVSKRLLVDTDD